MLNVLLVVNDDIDFLARARQVLSRHDLDVWPVRSAQAALNILWKKTPDVIVSAVDLPQISGWAFCRLLKSSPQHAHLPFIFLANESKSEDAVKAFQLDAEDYLVRPISFPELAARIHRRARKEAAPPPSTSERAVVSGQLGKVGIIELLQFLGLQGGAWSITLTNEPYLGQIQLAHGVVLQAVSGFLYGKVAFQDLLNWNCGSFSVEPLNEEVKQEGIGQSLEGLLLELAAQADELSHELANLSGLESIEVSRPSVYYPAA